MTLFGRTLDGQEIGSLVFLLTALVLWVMVWRGERQGTRWLRAWNAERKARRDAEIAAEAGETGPGPAREPRGPWG